MEMISYFLVYETYRSASSFPVSHLEGSDLGFLKL